MFSNLRQSLFSAFKLRNEGTVSSLQEWRVHLLDGVLGGIFILWLAALVGGINNVVVEYQDSGTLFENSYLLACLTISVYIASTGLFAFITFNRTLKYKLRASLLLATLYFLGTISMLLTSFSGDGRIFLFAFVIFTGIFFDRRSSLTAFFVMIFTLVVIGYLQVSEILNVPLEWQDNAALPGAWISGGIVLIFLSIAALVSIIYLFQALEGSLVETRKALQREQHLSQILRTFSEVNQLTTRIKDRESLLKRTCELLISDRGYTFAWMGLMEPDSDLLYFGASAGDSVDESKFNFNFGQLKQLPACVEVAIRSRTYVHVKPLDDDLCRDCPRRTKFPNRSAIALPLLHNDHILGAIVVDYNNPDTIFDEQEISLLQELADNLAYALANIEASTRLNTYAGHQKFLNEVTQTALSTVDLDTLLHEFVHKLEKALNADGYYFALWDEAKNLPSKFISSDNLRDVLDNFPPLQPDDKIFSRSILGEGRVLPIPDVMNSPFISPRLAAEFKSVSALGLPLITNEQRLGVLVFGYETPHVFAPEELELAEQASRQFALAILKVKLNEETQIKAAELEQLYSSAQDMASSLLDSSALLAKLARHLTEALSVTSVNITSINMATQFMRVVAEYWSNEAAPAEVHSDLGQEYPNSDYATILKYMIAGQVVVFHENDLELTEVERRQFVEYQIKSMMFVPIMSRGQILGTVEIWESRQRREFSEAEIRLVQAMTSHAGSILENAHLYEKLEQREAYFRALIENSAEGIAIIDSQGIVTYIVPSKEVDLGYNVKDLVGASAFKNMHPQDTEVVQKLFSESLEHPNRIISFEYRIQHKDGTWSHYEATGHNMLHDPNIHGIVVNYRNITLRKQTEWALKESQDRLFSIITTAPNGIIVIDSWSKIVLMNPAAERIFICSAAKMVGKNLDVLIPERSRASHHQNVQNFGLNGTSNRRIGRHDTLYGLRMNGQEFPMEAFISKYEMNGENFYTVTLQDITERKQDEDNLARRAEELQTLAFVSSALRVAEDVNEMIPLIVRHAVEIVAGDYGALYLLDETSNTLNSSGWYSVERGEDVKITGEPLLRHPFDKGITGYVAKTGEMYITEDLQLDPLASILPDEKDFLQNAHAGISLPLLSREKVIGVLHVRLTRKHFFTETETRLLTAIAEMAANALHRATLYEKTLQQAEELRHAYDSTLSGWARALEMRDELTEGHTRRVTELTLELARAMHVSESDIIQIRRGAILHDIGKMGIPDSILNKAGPLSAHEQRIMHMHPQYAHEMLSFIPFLKPALDIPYCHHEWWDGNGYPRGLKGQEIPLAARIFSVVDVWDALTSDRPYRPAWSPEKTLKYIQNGSGKQFDPHVVDAFLRLLETR